MKNFMKSAMLAITLGTVMTGTALAQNNPYRLELGPSEMSFVQDASQGHMLEIALGHLACKNGSSWRVKSFGKIMVIDHSKALRHLKDIAIIHRVDLMDSLDMRHMDMYSKLSGLSGTAFDSAYVSMMKDDHTEDYKAFQDAASKSVDMDVRSYADETAPVVKEHMDMINDIDSSMHTTSM